MIQVPLELKKYIEGYTWKPITIGHSEASTYRLEGESSNCYLKVQPIGLRETLFIERRKMEWLDGKIPIPHLLFYGEDEVREYLLMSEVVGEQGADPCHRNQLPSILASVGAGLKKIHMLPIGDCPFRQQLDRKIQEAGNRVKSGLVDEGHFDAVRIGRTAGDLFEELLKLKPAQEELVFAHGDFCLPNILIADGEVSGFIDWGRAGIADKYQDLALAIRSITSKFEVEFVPFFLEAYGVEEVDAEKVHYYQLLDEFF